MICGTRQRTLTMLYRQGSISEGLCHRYLRAYFSTRSANVRLRSMAIGRSYRPLLRSSGTCTTFRTMTSCRVMGRYSLRELRSKSSCWIGLVNSVRRPTISARMTRISSRLHARTVLRCRHSTREGRSLCGDSRVPSVVSRFPTLPAVSG